MVPRIFERKNSVIFNPCQPLENIERDANKLFKAAVFLTKKRREYKTKKLSPGDIFNPFI